MLVSGYTIVNIVSKITIAIASRIKKRCEKMSSSATKIKEDNKNDREYYQIMLLKKKRERDLLFRKMSTGTKGAFCHLRKQTCKKISHPEGSMEQDKAG